MIVLFVHMYINQPVLHQHSYDLINQ